jgi:hypothetical protein
MSVVEMAAVTGVLLRLYRAISISRGPEQSLLYVALTVAVGLAFLLTMTTLHLGNYTLKHWVWRAPAFALLEATAESLTSLALVALHREPVGSTRAAMADWSNNALDIFFWRILNILVFSLLLAGVVQLVRYRLVQHEHRGHTLDAVHHDAVLQTQERKEEEG